MYLRCSSHGVNPPFRMPTSHIKVSTPQTLQPANAPLRQQVSIQVIQFLPPYMKREWSSWFLDSADLALPC